MSKEKQEEYISRSYCKDIKCPIQALIDNKDPIVAIHKEYYKSQCIGCTAHHFHKWLKENNYKIVRDI